MKIIRQSKLFNILTKNYVTRAFSLYSLSNAISAVVGFGLLAVYTRYVSPEDFGKIALIWMFVTIATLFIEARLNTSFSVRFYKVSRKENIKNIYSIFAYYLVLWSAAFTAFLVFPSIFTRILQIDVSRADLIISFLLIIFTMVGNFYTNMLIVDQNPKRYFAARIIFSLTLIVSTVVFLVIMKLGYIAYFEAYLTANLIVSLIGLKYFISKYRPHKHVLSISRVKELLKIAIPLVPAGLLLMLLTWADRYILNLYVGLSIVGIYSIGYKFGEVINSFVINPFGQALGPLIYKQYAQSQEKYKHIVGTVLKYYWLVMSVIMVGYLVVIKVFFQIFLDPKYIEGYNVVGIVLLGVILYGASNYLGGTLVVAEKTGKSFLITAVSVTVNISLNFLLVPQYGMYGAAVATLISYTIQFVMILIYTQRLIFINYDWSFIFKSIAVSLCFFVLVYSVSFLGMNVFASAALKLSLFLLYILLSHKLFDLGAALLGRPKNRLKTVS